MANKVSRAGEYLLIAGMNLSQLSLDFTGDQQLRAVFGSGATLSGLTLTGCTGLESVTLNSLPAITSLALDGCSSLTSIELDGCPMNSFTVPNLPALTDLSLNDCPVNFASIEIGSCPALANVNASDCTGLAALIAGSLPAVTSLYADGCALTESYVDAILAALDTAGLSNGEVDLSGGTNAVPSAAGLTSKANLEGKGWTVSVNS